MSQFLNKDQIYIIAEVGINHNGSVSEAKKLIDASICAGANAVKFQVRDLDAIYTKSVLLDPLKAEHGTQYLVDELKRVELTHSDLKELLEYSKTRNIDFFATPFDEPSAVFLNELGIDLFKVGSPDFTNIPLIRLIARFGKPMILSTGMTTEEEIAKVSSELKGLGTSFSFLHCQSTYPAAYQDIQLKFIPRLKTYVSDRVGYSGHEQGFAPTIASVSFGARIIERHITFDQKARGPDHSASLTPSEFEKMVQAVRQVETSLGEEKRVLCQGEQGNRLNLAKSLVLSRDLKEGHFLEDGDLIARSPAKGVSPLDLSKFVGQKLCREMKKDDYIYLSDLESYQNKSRTYQISKKWGIVGRLNDFEDYLDMNPDHVEIHLTWRDVHSYERPKKRFREDLVVHAPEYYRDQLIDFTSKDSKVTENSLEMLQRTIDLARDLDKVFEGQKHSQGPRVVVHPGGHFMKPTESNRTDQYKRLIRNLRSVKTDGVRILVENMPPFPWYFGGQWYNTIFLDPKEIRQFAEELGWGVCYDLSHAQLYCNHSGVHLSDFTREILDHVAYLHVSDAKGSTQEGMQVGQGDIDFEQIFAIMNQLDVGFIPEIWQGHLNKGQGFREALAYLEKVIQKLSGNSCHHTHDSPGVSHDHLA